jgi:hypothetical protein
MSHKPTFDPNAPIANPGSDFLAKHTEDGVVGAGSPFEFNLTTANTGVTRVLTRVHPECGGYIGYLRVRPAGGTLSSNIAAFGAGRGVFNASIRDLVHAGENDATQAGYRRLLGTKTTVTQSATNADICVSKCATPFFEDSDHGAGFDFVFKENTYRDGFEEENPPSDADDFNEGAEWVNWDASDEIRSEMVFAAKYTNVSNWSENGVIAIRRQLYFAYQNEPKAIRQMSVPGGPVFRPGKFALNPSSRGIAVGADDWSGVNLSDGIRLFDESTAGGLKFRYRFNFDANEHLVYSELEEPVTGEPRMRHYTRILEDYAKPEIRKGRDECEDGNGLRGKTDDWEQATWDFNDNTIALQMVSTSSDINSGVAIGLFVPRNATNANPIQGYDRKSGLLKYARNRRIQSMFLVARDGQKAPYQTNLVYRSIYSALYNPTAGSGDIAEAIYCDWVMLFGTPAEILDAAQKLQGKLV